MNSKIKQRTATGADTTAAAPTMTRRIGQTVYKVNVHFNPDSKETMNDKIIRLIRNEASGKAAIK